MQLQDIMNMDYQKIIKTSIDAIKAEGRYREFADLKRQRGAFPNAIYSNDKGEQKNVTIWCANDYLGMGQNEHVIAAMHDAIDTVGAGSGGTRPGLLRIPRARALRHANRCEPADVHAVCQQQEADR